LLTDRSDGIARPFPVDWPVRTHGRLHSFCLYGFQIYPFPVSLADHTPTRCHVKRKTNMPLRRIKNLRRNEIGPIDQATAIVICFQAMHAQ
jgi:hypothetical protein